MESKKSKTADLESQRPTLLLLGLIFSFAITLQSFEWLKSDVIVKPISSFEDENLYEPINEIMIAKPQPKKRQTRSKTIKAKKGPVVVINKTLTKPEPNPIPNPNTEPKIGFDLTIDLPTTGDEVTTLIMTDEMLDFVKVEQKPKFIGGHKAMMQFIANNVKYPEYCKANGIQGKVYISFIIDKNGAITNVEIAKGKHKYLDKEAARVITKMPKWIPGKQRGKLVRVKYTIPVNYKLKG